MRMLTLLIGLSAAAFGATDQELIAGAERTAKNFMASIAAGNENSAKRHVYDLEYRPSSAPGASRRRELVPIQPYIDKQKRFGRLLERTLVKTEVVTDGPRDLPSGKFVKFTYTVRFEKKVEPQREIITIKVDNPQRWSVVGYSL